MGHFLQSAGRDYVILEKHQDVGSFFRHYPRARSLISFNRPPYPTDDQEFQWKGDWNSLLAADGPRFRDFDQRLLPRADSMVNYLKAFCEHHRLRVRTATNVTTVAHDGDRFVLESESGDTFLTRSLVMAAALKPRHPPIPGFHVVTEHYDNVSVRPDDYSGQRVMILGKRNSAFEIANIV